uniref:Uncharacterized protein n=1 Tax=Knipowitschia caucasica TaxID=637954 RepID=A0AAV2KCD9_KNICA
MPPHPLTRGGVHALLQLRPQEKLRFLLNFCTYAKCSCAFVSGTSPQRLSTPRIVAQTVNLNDTVTGKRAG